MVFVLGCAGVRRARAERYPAQRLPVRVSSSEGRTNGASSPEASTSSAPSVRVCLRYPCS
jgi:hypothetical protein